MHSAASNCSSNQVLNHAWSSSQEPNPKLKRIHNGYSHPIDNLANLKRAIIPSIARIPSQMPPTVQSKDLTSEGAKSGNKGKLRRAISRRVKHSHKLNRAPTHAFVNNPLMQSDEVTRIRLIKQRKMSRPKQ